ncbi:MAG TPA: TIM-barrel domain-containing protein [Cellvibrio sp.]|nr:TIM-barrel domain-containing protein [Cellvibrio sp.]
MKNNNNILLALVYMLVCGLMVSARAAVAEAADEFSHYTQLGRSIIVSANSGQKLRITPYGGAVVRVQVAAPGQDFLPDSHYEMVERHDWDGSLKIDNNAGHLHISLDAKADRADLFVELQKETLRLAFGAGGNLFLREKFSTEWLGSLIRQQFVYDDAEHFAGLGHGYFGRVDSLDLRGQELERNYQRDHEQQAPLLVPFYISSKGYGVFLNSSFRNKFRFGVEGSYSFSLDTGNYSKDGQMDYFVIAGPQIKDVLRRYIALTGHPRMPSKAMFGLALSDKGDPKTSDGDWWKNKVRQHREAGFPLDHLVNDNRWRASGGERCKSEFAWDGERYSSPRKFVDWANDEHLLLTLDFNRCIAPHTEGYDQASFNIPNSEGMDFKDAAPDLTSRAVRQWWWKVLYNKGIKPMGNSATVGLWIDEFDQMGPAPDDQLLSNGRSFAEMRNYWFMLVSKGLAAEGWDKDIGEAKRPFIWVRGNTAGAQRYSTLWSGDIQPTYAEMKSQIRGMQAAGLSGFPFWGHDAGGFDSSNVQDFDTLYRQWSLAMGSFSPFWKPHGIGPSRWPRDRSVAAQADFLRFSNLRYQLMPYTYSYAHAAFATGEPIARPMLFNYPEIAEAWKRDLQYLWGDNLLVAPNTDAPSPAGDKVSSWLPPGPDWYDFWNDKKYTGGQEIFYPVTVGQLPLFVLAGSILPMSLPSLSIAEARKDLLEIHVYSGADGKFTLYEDDEVSEKYQRGAWSTQEFIYSENRRSLKILPLAGRFKGMAKARGYRLVFHGLEAAECMAINGRPLNLQGDIALAQNAGEGAAFWAADKRQLSVFVPQQTRKAAIEISRYSNCGQP